MKLIDSRIVRTSLLALALGTAGAVAMAETSAEIRFASVDEGKAVLGAPDEWSNATNDFLRAATAGVAPPLDAARFLAIEASQVQPWTDAERASWQQSVDLVKQRLVDLHVPTPPQILLVKTTGRDMSDAPYTRRNAVMIPASVADGALGTPDKRRDILAHELFHVVSRNAPPEFTTRLYETIGFHRIGVLQWPAAWAPARIVNPDAPVDQDAMTMKTGDHTAMVMPIIMATRTDLKPGENFFAVMDVRLLEVMRSSDGKSVLPVMKDGKPVWHALADSPDYFRQLGGNTPYVIHPQETMADNFAFLVTGKKVRNPDLLKRIQDVLMQPH